MSPAEETPTQTDVRRPGSTPSSGAMDEGRFPPGTVLAQRYRIVSLLGRGGMGEVYRANDLLLGQTVALKFLPPALTSDEAALTRFRNEVRTARLVSHPSVCRVFDLGETEGLTYLTMEYVDGEDLSSLLRRIGRLPHDKALDIARKLCAGLAAAHDQGVLHRDLKPANIMLDGQGHVRITDFGLAGFADQMRDVRSGTRAYMAPEQLAAREVTARSDIYALGVVLHELFTGKHPSAPGSKAEADPAVDRVIQRCLQEDPRKRPATALAVAAALPGGDPLAMALAAGETPTPEMVANAGDVEGMRVGTAVACLAAVVVTIVGMCFYGDKTDILNRIPLEHSPQVLAAKAREIAKSLGYTNRPVDTASGWDYETDFLQYAQRQPDAGSPWLRLRGNRPPAVSYWYLESPAYLASPAAPFTALPGGPVTRPNTPLGAGMIFMALDTEGRLIEFRARPLPEAARAIRAPDWRLLFTAAGLDLAQLTPAEPAWTPEAACDAQAAWKGSWPDSPSDALTVEAGAYRGQPVFFRMAGPWSQPKAPVGIQSARGFVLVFLVVIPFAAALMVRRNARLGRGDRSGAFRLAGFIFVCQWVMRNFQYTHSASMTEVSSQLAAVSNGLLAAGMFWAMYMAFEPYIRRRSPRILVSWNRLLAGKLRDPLLGGHVLAGVALGSALAVIQGLRLLAGPLTLLNSPAALQPDTGASVSLIAWHMVFSTGGGVGCLMMLVLFRSAVRREWAAVLACVAVTVLIFQPPPGPAFPIRLFLVPLVMGGLFWILLRLGLLPMIVASFSSALFRVFPLTSNLSAWYAKDALLAMAIVLALAVYGFRTTLAGRPLWRDDLRES